MKLQIWILSILGLLFTFPGTSQSTFSTHLSSHHSNVICMDEHGNQLVSPKEGLWSIATEWKDNWPAKWHHAQPDTVYYSGDWTILSGTLHLDGGKMYLRDAYRYQNGMIKCIRRYEWTGKKSLSPFTAAIRWQIKGNSRPAFLPGILYYGNPSGKKNRPEWVPGYTGKPGEKAIFEEHRYPMPFACVETYDEKHKFGASLHSIPSPLKSTNLADHWWSLGVIALEKATELVIYSGPVAYNGQKNVSKALQSKAMELPATYLTLEPGTIIEKTFFLDVHPIKKKGTAFQQPLYKSLDLFKPYYRDDLPEVEEIIKSKIRFARSRWKEGDNYAGFSMYPDNHAPHIVMGWCGQAATCGYAFQQLNTYVEHFEYLPMIQKSLDFLSQANVDKNGFPVRYDITNEKWSSPDHVSMGQGMHNIALAIKSARKNKSLISTKWEAFLKRTCDYASEHILDEDWYPISTAEGFYIAPLIIASQLFESALYKKAALKAADHFAKRHIDMKEPYWGGTLDASGEDKEGAWAAFQGFLAVYELTKDKKYLAYAKHASDVCLSYTVVWDIPLPAGRMADHFFKTRGWTMVSPQNQHIDVYGVLYAPEIYKMGIFLNKPELKKLALVMFRSCGQLIDPLGSQGEQLQQTNFAQHGNMSDVTKLRGGYSEGWTVFWITAHFLKAAAQFEEMGVFK